MVKQTKKGSIGKKALSAILAASMIMTSSSFVMAGPVVEEVEAVAVEEVAAEVENINVEDENVGTIVTVDEIDPQTYTGEAIEPEITFGAETLVKGQDYTVSYANNINATPADATADNGKMASATISFIGKDYGENKSVTKYFKINPFELTASNTKITYGNVTAFVYNGTEQHTDITKVSVTLKEATSTEPAKVVELSSNDYELAAKNTGNLIDAGTKKWALTAKGNFEGTLDLIDYTIEKATLTDEYVEISTKQIPYNNALTADAVKNAMTIKDKSGKELAKDTFNVEFQDANGAWVNTPDGNVGVHNLRIVPTSSNVNFKDGSVVSTYEIVKTKTLAMFVSDASVGTFPNGTVVYDGTDKCPATDGKITVGNMGTLKAGIDYEITTAVSEWKNVGQYTIDFKGLNAYAGETASLTVEITPKALNKNATEVATGITTDVSFGTTHSGNPSTVVVAVKDGAVELEAGKDFTYTTTVEKGADGKNDAYAVITGIGNYTTALEDGKVTTLTTAKVDQKETLSLQDASISATVKTAYQYDGTAKKPAAVTDIEVIENDSTAYTLTADDYYVSAWNKNTAAGIAEVTIKGKGKYDGERTIEFEIAGTPISDVIALDTTGITSLNYTGNDLLPQVLDSGKLKAGFGKVVFKATNAAYSSYKAEVYKEGSDTPLVRLEDMGTYKLVIKSTEDKYSGTLEASFQVVGSTIEGAIIDPIADQEWTGEAIEPAVVVKVGPTQLVEGKDYTVTYANNVKVGMAYLTVEGIGKYAGQIISSFNIVGEMDQPIEVRADQEKALQNRTLNDKATKVKYVIEPETTVTYTSSDEDVVTVDAEGNIKYTGLGEATITIKAAAENDYKEAVKELKVVVGLKQPTFSPSSKDNAFTVTTSTVKGAEKFQVQYVPTGKSFTSKAAKSKTFTVDNKLKKGKISAANKETYRIRVRAINGDTKSKWSPVKTIATK